MSLKLNFWIDFLVFAGFLVALEPRLTGTTVHEWFTLSAAGALIIHFLLHWDWFVGVTKRFFGGARNLSRLNYLLAILVFIGFVTIITSGLMISRSVGPALGLPRGEGFTWRAIHSLASNVTLLLVALHFGLHWDWVVKTLTRLFLKPSGRHNGEAVAVTVPVNDRQAQ